MIKPQNDRERKNDFKPEVYQEAFKNLMVAYCGIVSPEPIDSSLVEANIELYLRRAKLQLEMEPYNERRES